LNYEKGNFLRYNYIRKFITLRFLTIYYLFEMVRGRFVQETKSHSNVVLNGNNKYLLMMPKFKKRFIVVP